ncbi:MAG: hypothetical protein HYW81_01120 [Parcubacteria group bacterium]|nr:hypothetical protein [Parcubacteria group bacterium]
MARTTKYVYTHGDKEDGPDPGMTEEGFAQVETLRDVVLTAPSQVVCGTGQRHFDVALALKLGPHRFTAVVGGPDSLEKDLLDAQGKRRVVLMACGYAVPPDQYTTLQDMAPACKALIASLPDQARICAGRPCMIMLGNEDAKSAAVYAVHCEDGEIVNIEELAAYGEAEKGTV